MDSNEIFDKLMQVRESQDVELTDSDNALLWDVAIALGLNEDRAAKVAGDNNEATAADENPADFSHSGLGIGGLATHVDPVVIPTVAAIERVEKMEACATYCFRCGQSDVFDGARFGNGGGNVCDDCWD